MNSHRKNVIQILAYKKLIVFLLLLTFMIPLNLSAKNWLGFFGEDDVEDGYDKSLYAISPEELEGVLYAYADSYQASIFSATLKMANRTDDVAQRHLATLLRTYAIGSMYDIATNPDPYTKLLDMLLVTTLQSYVWIDEDLVGHYFGDNGQLLIEAIHQNRLEIWDIAKKVMKPEQLYLLDWLIIDWRRQNPDVDNVSYIRFSDVGASRGKTLIADVEAGTGFLAPVNEAKKALDEARLLAERSFYYAKRAPLLYSWQAESVTDSMLAKPEIKQLLTSVNVMTNSIDRVTNVLEKLPEQMHEERQFLVAELDKRESSLSKLLKEVQQTVGDTEHLVLAVDNLSGSSTTLVSELGATSDSLNITLQTLDTVLTNHFSDSENEAEQEATKPFDISEYTQALTELDKTITHMTSLVDTSDDFVLSEDMTERIKQVNIAAEERVEHASRQSNLVLGTMFFYAVVFSFFIFLLFVSYRYLVNKKIGMPS